MKVRLLTLLACFAAAACESGGNDSAPVDPNAPGSTPPQAGAGTAAMMPVAGAAAMMPVAGAPAMMPVGGAPAMMPVGGAPAMMPLGGAPATTPPPADPGPPFGPDADVFVWSTDTFDLDAGQEQYLCFAKTLEEDLVINAYASAGDSFVHHLIFARVTAPEPEGFAECDVAFRNSWETLYISGAGDTKLEFPDDAGHQLTTGTQLLVQMHLLNTAATPVSGKVTITMRRSAVANPRPVNSFIFGTAAVELPAGQRTEVVGTCSLFQSVQLIAGFPHMHLLGTSMTFEAGPSEGALKQIFQRDPFDFNDQRIERVDATLSAGDVTRVRCTFDNTHDKTVGYGESTLDEMCYFVGFAVDQPSMSACLEVLPPNIFGGG